MFFFLFFNIGYARIVLAVVSFYFMPTNYVISSWCYIISVLLDALDGHAARKFNQCNLLNLISFAFHNKQKIDKSLLCHWAIVDSHLSSYIITQWFSIFSDQVRCDARSTYRSLRNNGFIGDAQLFLSKVHVLVPAVDGYRCLLSLVLPPHVSENFNPKDYPYSLPLLSRTILQGKTSHKFIDMNENPIMHIYYTNRTVLGFMCLFNELFYAALYLLYFTPGPIGEFSSFSPFPSRQ